MKHCLCFILSWVFFVHATAQDHPDTLGFRLPNALVIGPAFEPQNDLDHAFDSVLVQALPASSLAELLEMGTVMNLRVGGPKGSVVSGSDMGLSADHLLVTWMGVPLNSPSLGMMDLSAIPAGLFELPILQGASSMTRSQGGAAAGRIHLKGEHSQGDRFRLGTSMDELSNSQVWSRNTYHLGKRFSASTAFQVDRAKNRFSFFDPLIRDSGEREQFRNDFQREAFVQEFQFDNGSNLRAQAGLWLQASRMELPEVLGSLGQSYTDQADSSLRVHAGVQHYRPSGTWSLRLAQFNDHMHYSKRFRADADPAIDSRISTQRSFIQAGWEREWEGLRAEVFTEQSVESVGSLNHGNHPSGRTLQGVQARVAGAKKGWNWNLGLRHDRGIGAGVWLPEAKLAYRSKRHSLQIQGGRIFRYPDLNELYWMPGGNETLRPETGYQTNLSYTLYSGSNGRHQVRLAWKNMDELIAWQTLNATLQAVNASEVQAISIGLDSRESWKFRDLKIEPHLQVNLQKTDGLPEALRPFFPLIRGRAAGNVRYKQFFAGLALRYTAEDWRPSHLNTTHYQQNAVLLFDAFTGGCVKINDHLFTVGLTVRNLGDVMDFRVTPVATPGRFLSLKLEYLFNQTNQ